MTSRPMFVVTLLLICAGCDRKQSTKATVHDDSSSETAPTGHDGQTSQSLPDIPVFPLETLEPTVRAQLGDALNTVQANPENAAANGQLGMLFHIYDIHSQAEVCYRRALILDEGDRRWHYYHGLVLVRMGDWDRARRALSRFVDQQPDYVPALLELADLDFRQNRYEQARSRFENVLNVSPKNPVAMVGLARCQMQADQFRDAIQFLMAALDIAPRYGHARYILAQALRKTGRKKDALEQVGLADKQRELTPPLDDPLRGQLEALATGAIESLHRGIELMQSNHPRQALPLLEESLRLNPNLPETHAQIGTAYLLVDQNDLAEKHLKRALEMSPAYVQAHYNLGLLAHRKQQWSIAANHFQAACNIEPSHFDANLGLGTAMQKRSQHAAAVAPFRVAIRSSPTDPRAYKRLAESLMQLESYADALVVLENGHRELPNDGSVTDRLAWLLAVCPDEKIRDPDRAIMLAQKVCNRTKWRIPRPLDTLAAAHAARGEFERAFKTASIALKKAREAGKHSLAEEIHSRLSLYQDGARFEFLPDATDK